MPAFDALTKSVSGSKSASASTSTGTSTATAAATKPQPGSANSKVEQDPCASYCDGYSTAAGPGAAGAYHVDVQELAERVYALLRRELIIERERLGGR